MTVRKEQFLSVEFLQLGIELGEILEVLVHRGKPDVGNCIKVF